MIQAANEEFFALGRTATHAIEALYQKPWRPARKSRCKRKIIERPDRKGAARGPRPRLARDLC